MCVYFIHLPDYWMEEIFTYWGTGNSGLYMICLEHYALPGKPPMLTRTAYLLEQPLCFHHWGKKKIFTRLFRMLLEDRINAPHLPMTLMLVLL